MSRAETVGAAGAGRFSEIDHLKAIGILAVILIHSLRDPWNPNLTTLEVWLQNLTRFAVPGFLFCSGFLYATREPVRFDTVLRRLRRVLVPYLIASIGAQLWLYAHGSPRDVEKVVREVLLASSFGPFYYVFVHFWLVLVAPLFARLPMRALWGLTIALLVSQGLIETRVVQWLSFFWQVRDPLMWWGYFLVGWMVRLHYVPIRAFVRRHRGVLGSAAGIFVVLLAVVFALVPGRPSVYLQQWIGIHGIIASIFVVTCGGHEPSRPVRLLSDATFAIYLFHLFFVYAVKDLSVLGFTAIALSWCAGLLGSLTVVVAVRRVLGPRSRDVIGA